MVGEGNDIGGSLVGELVAIVSFLFVELAPNRRRKPSERRPDYDTLPRRVDRLFERLAGGQVSVEGPGGREVEGKFMRVLTGQGQDDFIVEQSADVLLDCRFGEELTIAYGCGLQTLKYKGQRIAGRLPP